MTAAASSARAWLLAGDVYLARFANGVADAPQGPFEANKFALTPKSTTKNQTSKGRSTYGQAIETVALPDVPEFEIELTEVNRTTLAIALLGDGVLNAQNSGALAAQPVVVALDSWVDVGFANLGDLTVKDATDTTIYAEGIDYIVNPNLGWLKALPGGAIANAATVHVTGPYTAFNDTVISGMSDTQIRLRATFDGVNLVDNSPVIAIVYEAVVSAKSAIDLLLSDFNKVSLTGSMKTPAGMVTPFVVKLRSLS